MIQYVTSLFSALNKNQHPGDIAHGVAMGFFLALMPKDNLLWVIVFSISVFVRMNKGALFLSLILLGFLTPFCDVAIERVGFWVLSLEFMQPIYVALDTVPFVGLTRFYNTMVAGSVVLGLLSYAPVYALTRVLVSAYRKKFQNIITSGHNKKAAGILSKIPLLRHLAKIEKVKEFFGK